MQFLKSTIKGAIERRGYEFRRKPSHLPPDARFGLNILDCLITKLVEQTPPKELRLLQIGANDGQDEDVVRLVLQRHPIPALLCEPLFDAFEKLEKTYAGLPHVKLARCAVGITDGEMDIFRIDPSVGNAEATKIASVDREHVVHFQRIWELPPSSVVSEKVACSTVSSLLKSNGWKSVDIAVLDMEGMDHLICPALLQLNPLPSIIQFEYANSPIEAITALMEQLTESGYHFSRSGLDIIAARPH